MRERFSNTAIALGFCLSITVINILAVYDLIVSMENMKTTSALFNIQVSSDTLIVFLGLCVVSFGASILCLLKIGDTNV